MGRILIASVVLAGCTQEVGDEIKDVDLDACQGKCDSAELNEGHFEYVVVGSGAGGGPLASNLARAGHKVLLLEAGDLVERGSESNTTRADLLLPENAQLVSDVPAFHPLASENPAIAWSYFVNHYSDQTQAMRDSKYVAEEGGILYPRGGTVGGSTAVNALITVYPHDSDWNGIAQITGDPSWRAEEMRRYFVRLERNNYLGLLSRREGHGFEGWLSVEQPDARLGLLDSQIRNTVSAAAFTVGDGVFSDIGELLKLSNRDMNAFSSTRDSTEGVFTIPTATRDGVRNGTRDYILETIERGYPLTLRTRALVTNVVFSDTPEPDGRPRAIGVEYLSGGDLYRADADADPSAPMGEKIRVTVTREVILSAGAFNTPQLLMLSGIGPEDQLREHGIDVLVHSPGVGRNLQDRYEVPVVIESDTDLSLTRDCTFDLTPGDACFREWEDSEGVYTANGGIVSVVRRSSVARLDPDLFVFALGGEFRGYEPNYSVGTTSRNRLTWLVLKAHTENTAGTVRLRSADPRDTPQIDFNYFAEGGDRDMQAMVEGVQFVREIVTKTNDLLLGSHFGETWPGPEVDTPEEIAQFVRDESWGHHASCTAPIGADGDPNAVLDTRFRVRGVSNLRVVDASAFPRIPGFFPVVAVFMLAERATDVILEDVGQPLRQRFGNVTEVAIPDDRARDVVSEIVVPDGAPALTDVSVTVHIRHSYRGDLSVVLERDGIQPITLVHRQGSFRNDINETFQIPALQGQSSAGTWRLRVKDHARGDAGVLTAWSMQWH